VGFLVVCFSKLDNNLPIVPGFGNEDRLAGFRVWVCVLLVLEFNPASGGRIEGGDVGEKPGFRNNIEIHAGIKHL